jgi:predicted acylesterase/phospholipase RssA
MSLSYRSILYLAPLTHCFDDLCDAMRRQSWVTADGSGDRCEWAARGLRLRVDLAPSVVRALELLGGGYYSLVVVDCRNLPHDRADRERQQAELMALLDALRDERDRERRYPLRRVAVLVGDADWDRVDGLLFDLGQRHVGGCVRDRSLSEHILVASRSEARRRFVEGFWDFCHRVLTAGRPGRKAICMTGGGITGIYHELGVLKCLHDSFDCDLRDLDLFFGISGGSVVAACLANGIHIDEQIAKIGAIDAGWDYKLKLSWRHLNVAEVPRRLLLVQRELFKYMVRTLSRQDDFSVASILGTWAVLLGPIFDNSGFEAAMRRLFSVPGRSNDFRELGRRLYIGATDQDSREHVLFGSGGYDEVPISQAIQASAAMHPFFPSVEIGGRYYTDGVVSRTANLRAAVDRGADLVFVIDPFVPLVSDEHGFNARHGNMWIVEQDFKTLSYTRFEQARNEIARQHPDVNIYTFVPSNRMRRLMAGQNPFVSRNFHPIVCAGYRSTYRRLRQLEYKIAGELRSHGIHLDLDPVEAKIGLLRQARRPDVRLLLDEWEPKRRRGRAA